MKNDLFSIGPLTVRGYGLMLAVGVMSAVLLSGRLFKKRGLDDEIGFNAVVIGILFGFLGAKLGYLLTELPTYIAHPSYIIADLGSGFMVYTGVLLGVGSACLYLRRKKEPVLAYTDSTVPAIALAQGFGRIGCFLAGCCYGQEAETPFSVIFPPSSVGPSGVPLIATQLISSSLNFIHAGLLLWVWSRKPKNGFVSALYGCLYAVGRFAVEYYRDDPRGSVGPFSTSQFISVVLLPFFVFFLWRSARGGEPKGSES